MTQEDKPHRLQVIEGGGSPGQHRKRTRAGDGEPVSAYECAPCSAALGYSFSQLVQVRNGGFDKGGKLVGGALWYACPRCHALAYKIRNL